MTSSNIEYDHAREIDHLRYRSLFTAKGMYILLTRHSTMSSSIFMFLFNQDYAILSTPKGLAILLMASITICIFESRVYFVFSLFIYLSERYWKFCGFHIFF